MDIRPRHIGNQERFGITGVIVVAISRRGQFLWQLANAFRSFCDDAQSCREHYRVSRITQLYSIAKVLYIFAKYNGAVLPRKHLETAVFRNISEMRRLFKRACKLHIDR